MRQSHFVLVPGFAGFEVLGSLDYFSGVVDLFHRLGRGESEPPTITHLVQATPGATIEKRARALREWLVEQLLRGAIRGEDRLHLVGHSTGGLDLRQALFELDERRGRPATTRAAITADELLDQVATVQLISTPHRGMLLARYAADAQPQTQQLLRGLSFALRVISPTVLVGLGLFKPRKEPEQPATRSLYDALLELVRGGASTDLGWQGTRDRAAFAALLRWLEEISTDFSAAAELSPRVDGETPTSSGPVQRELQEGELAIYRDRPTRSIVTRAAARDDAPYNIYGFLEVIHDYDPLELGPPVSLPLLLAPETSRRVESGDNDGVVPTLSMVFPDKERCLLVEADHADVIGHFQRSDGSGYDLLPSAAEFDEETFERVWTSIRRFALSLGDE